jgi:hypothetical protein
MWTGARNGSESHPQKLLYHLIGSDGRQYGPATLEQLQRWVAEGRVNNRTLVRPEGAAGWRPLAESTGQAPPPLPPMTGVPTLPDVGDDARVACLRRHFRRDTTPTAGLSQCRSGHGGGLASNQSSGVNAPARWRCSLSQDTSAQPASSAVAE